jgi:hypothetical protein
MAIKIKTPYFRSFNMPQSCVVCGGQPANQTTEVSYSTWGGKTNLSMKFPVCLECSLANKKDPLAILVRLLGVFAALPLCFAAFCANSGLEGVPSWVSWVLWAMVIGVPAFSIWWSNWINTHRLTPEQLERRKRVADSVWIENFKTPGFSQHYLVFAFENQDFAQKFSVMNGGEVVAD